MKVSDIDRGELERLWDAIRSLQSQAPIGFSSVSRGALEITSPEGLVVGKADGDGAGQGSQKVYGTLNVTGTLNGDGTIDWDGPVQLQGKVDVTGTMHVKGGGSVIVSQEGDANYSMRVLFEDGKGKLVAFGVPVELRAWATYVQLNENGLQIGGGGGTITMTNDGIQIVSPAGAAGPWIELKSDGIYFRNLPDS